MRRARAAIAVAASAWAFACASPSREAAPTESLRLPTLTPGFELDSATGVLVHLDTGARLPTELDGLVRGDTHAFDSIGENVSIAYGFGERLWTTLYLYPRGVGAEADPMQHFRFVLNDVLANAPDSEVESARSIDLPLGPGAKRGHAAFVRLRHREREFGSLVLLVAEGTRFAKVRTSFSNGDDPAAREEAWRVSTDLLRLLPPSPWSP
jgi:hypothetical protein